MEELNTKTSNSTMAPEKKENKKRKPVAGNAVDNSKEKKKKSKVVETEDDDDITSNPDSFDEADSPVKSSASGIDTSKEKAALNLLKKTIRGHQTKIAKLLKQVRVVQKEIMGKDPSVVFNVK